MSEANTKQADERAWRVEDKRNVHMNGKRTAFKFYRREGNQFVHAGQFTARGWSASDEDCAAAALDNIASLADD